MSGVTPGSDSASSKQSTSPMKGFSKYLNFEDTVDDKLTVMHKRIEGYVDAVAPQVSQMLGLTEVKWTMLGQIGAGIYMVLSMIVLWARPDFLNVIVF